MKHEESYSKQTVSAPENISFTDAAILTMMIMLSGKGIE